MSPPPPPPILLFPPAPTLDLTGNAPLQSALDAAIASVTIPGNPPHFGLTVVDLGNTADDNPGNFLSAGFNQTIEHYAASMMKVVCMYAAFSLRNLVERFNAARKPKSAEELFQGLHKELDPQIDVCCPMITGRAANVRVPRWRDVFAASGTPGALNVRFSAGFTTSLEQMIVPSEPDASGRCIRGVGYAYMNGLMLKHGFFDSSTKKGLWLAGDYGASEVVEIPCDNDGVTKQGATTAMMARLGLIIFMGGGPGAGGNGEMVKLLTKSSNGGDSSYFTRSSLSHPMTHNQVVWGKIGWGPLKSKQNVLSDLNMIVNPLGHGGSFMVCYTNIDQVSYFIGHVLNAFRETVRAYQSVSSAASTPAASTGGVIGATAH
jgi:hypothetical protein